MPQNSGLGVGGVLLVIFVVAKLLGVIAWSWWLVLSPLWLPFLVVALIWGLGLAVVYFSDPR